MHSESDLCNKAATDPDRDGVLKIFFDFDEFDAHNSPLESAHYYDKEQNPCLTAKQAGYYKPQDDLYFDSGERLDELMEIESDAAIKLFQQFIAEKTNGSYVQWLERRVLSRPA